MFQMSMVPLFFRDWWTDMDMNRPSRIFDQDFGMGIDRNQLISSLSSPSTRTSHRPSGYYRPWGTNLIQRQNSSSTISCDKDKFQVTLDVQQFSPEEITVKTAANIVTVEAKHEEKQDEHGFISRQFVRRYVIPEGLDMEKVQSSLSSDGVLTISVPNKVAAIAGEKVVPIQQVGPIKTAEQNINQQK